MKKTRFLFALAICFSIALGTPAVVSAQENNPAMAQADDDDDDDADYGWIGLIGLAGLLGLKKKDRDDRDDRVRTGNTTVR